MKRKAKELQMAKREARKDGRSMYSGYGSGSGGFGSHDMRSGPTVESLPQDTRKPSYNAHRYVHNAHSTYTMHTGTYTMHTGTYTREVVPLLSCFSRSKPSGSAMKLGKKGKDVESFVDKLMAEGESKCFVM